MDNVSSHQIHNAKNNNSLTFLNCLEGVIRLNKFYGVCDFLALQNVIVEAEVWDGQLENLVIPRCILLEDGAFRGKKKKRQDILFIRYLLGHD